MMKINYSNKNFEIFCTEINKDAWCKTVNIDIVFVSVFWIFLSSLMEREKKNT